VEASSLGPNPGEKAAVHVTEWRDFPFSGSTFYLKFAEIWPNSADYQKNSAREWKT